jgi:WD40 repeat protein
MESRDRDNLPNEQQQPPSPKAIVCIYAGRDEPFYHELQTHLFIWQNKGHIRWLELDAGANVGETWQVFIQHADMILLLVSADFFVTRVCHKAMEYALAEQAKRDVPVVPVLARVCIWKESDCGELGALPGNELPIAEWEHRERAYENIRVGLARRLPGLSVPSTPSGRPRLFQARDLPKGYVPRPKAFEAIKRLLLDQRGGQMTAITTALLGPGGFGKTTLALALCHDPEIQAAFSDGILWVELGEQPPRTLDLLNGLLAPLGVSHTGAITLDEARDRWRTALQDRVFLLVIDDVWQTAALELLLEGGPQCVRLVTTRNDQVLPEEAARVRVDAMEPAEAIAVLHRGLPDEIQQAAYQPTLETLVTRLGCWPLLLTLAHGMLATLVSYGQSIAEALTTVEQAYQTRGVTAFHLSHARERQRTADACLEVSFHHLEEFTPTHYQAAARYQELAVFPEDMDLSLTTLQIFWNATGGLETWETNDLCLHLHRLSLLLTCDLGKGTIRLHDVMRTYLQQKVNVEVRRAFHQQLLNAYKCQRWAELPHNEVYLWEHLAGHLIGANRSEELVATVKDGEYLAVKTRVCSVYAIEADIDIAIKQAPTDASLRLLKRSIARISHLLNRCKTLPEVASILHSRLSHLPELSNVCMTLEKNLTRPFLTSWYAFADLSHTALIRTLEGHKDWVKGCAVDPMGDFIVSASFDKTLKVWDAQTGIELQTLKGHTNGVNGCAVGPLKTFIVSASSDETLKLWDARTRNELHILKGHTSEVYGCAVSPAGNFIVSTSSDKTLKLWDARTRTELHILTDHEDMVNGCAVSPDGSWIVSASSDGTLKVWDVLTGDLRLTLANHTDGVYDCAISPDGNWIVSASSDGTLKV